MVERRKEWEHGVPSTPCRKQPSSDGIYLPSTPTQSKHGAGHSFRERGRRDKRHGFFTRRLNGCTHQDSEKPFLGQELLLPAAFCPPVGAPLIRNKFRTRWRRLGGGGAHHWDRRTTWTRLSRNGCQEDWSRTPSYILKYPSTKKRLCTPSWNSSLEHPKKQHTSLFLEGSRRN